MKLHRNALVVLSVLAFTWPAVAQDCPELIGHWPYGGSFAVAVSDGYAYLGNGTTLTVADLSDPVAPQVVGDVELPSIPQSIAVSGGHAYVAAGERGLRVVDVSTPSAPVEVGWIDFPAGHAAGSVAVAGRYACVIDRYEGLRVIDVGTPSAPVEVGFVPTSGFALHVALDGGHAYVVENTALRVIDLSTPSAPVVVGSLNLPPPASATGVAVSGGYAYVVEYYSGLLVIDVRAPSSPVLVGSLDLPTRAWVEVALSGGYAFVTDGTEGLRVIDVGTPSAPVEVGFVDTPGTARAVAVAAGYAYVEDGGTGLRVIDVRAPAAPVEVGFVDTPGGSGRVAVAGGYAYVATGSGLRVMDVGTASEPVQVGFADTDGASGVAVSGGYAWVAAGSAGLRVVDVSNPSAPLEIGFVDTPGGAGDVAVSRGHAYVVGSGGLRVIDVSTPTAPVEVAFLSMSYNPGPLAVSEGYAYLTYWIPIGFGLAGLLVIDVSTPSAPVEVGHVTFGGFPNDLAVSGRYAYIANYHEGLRIIDVSEPSAPVRVGAYFSPRHFGTYGVAVQGGYAYVSASSLSDSPGSETAPFLRVVDVSSPSAPIELGSVQPAGLADIALSDGRVIVTGGDAGIYVFDDCDGGPHPDPRESFIPAAAVAAGAEGAFFQTDVELNNSGPGEAQVVVQWLPRAEDNSEPLESEPIALSPGHSVRLENVLTRLFGLGADSYGALRLVGSTDHLIGMSRTYTSAGSESPGNFGQGIPAIRATEMISGVGPRRILLLSESPDFRANLGCVNGSSEPVRISIGVFDNAGTWLETLTMDLGPYGNDQVNRVLSDWAPVNGYVDVWADRDDALYACYGSTLDNRTSDPTTILPQVPSADRTFIPAAALTPGLEGSFFSTDVDLNNVGSTAITYELLWLPRWADNSDPVRSEAFTLAPGAGVRYANVIAEVFGLAPDQIGALAVEASGTDLLAMSRTYNLPPGDATGTFGQGLPGIPADRMIPSGVRKRIIFLDENDEVRSNVGCQNGSAAAVQVFVELFDSEGESLETRTIDLGPYSNDQITRVFSNHAPITSGYVEVWTTTPGATISCYGSMLDNLTSDPTTVLPR